MKNSLKMIAVISVLISCMALPACDEQMQMTLDSLDGAVVAAMEADGIDPDDATAEQHQEYVKAVMKKWIEEHSEWWETPVEVVLTYLGAQTGLTGLGALFRGRPRDNWKKVVGKGGSVGDRVSGLTALYLAKHTKTAGSGTTAAAPAPFKTTT